MSARSFLGDRDDERTLVCIFLRGGADGLTLVPPVGDDDYHRRRPRLAIRERDALRLDGFFGLHPDLAELAPLVHDGRLAVVHACGSDDDTRSHFEAQDLMEHGGTSVAGGWIGRWLRASAPAGAASPLDALAFGTRVPESLRGAPSASALHALEELAPDDGARALRAKLGTLYDGDELLGPAAHDALAAAERIAELVRTPRSPANGARYPTAEDGEPARRFGRALAQVARLVDAQVGVRAVTIEIDGWDSHFVQDQLLAPQLRALGRGLAEFARDLGPRLDTTSVVVLSEFGRRVDENASFGTDHGRGGTLFVLGGGTPGGIHCRWPGLSEQALVGPGDLPVVHDYRDALASVLARHGAAEHLARIFPDHALAPLPV